jgi:uracil-DNA glycosylase family 4
MLTERQLQYLRAMGIQAWAERVIERPEAVASVPRAGMDNPPARVLDFPDWSALEARVAACTRCALHQTRTLPVFGVGDRAAQWMIVGEAPGAEEDRQGEPFVGRAGQLLNEMLAAIGLDRKQVYITNILKSRPPNNRDPSPEEVAACEPYLKAQIALIRPRIILAVGRIAAQNLLKTDERIGALRGRVHRYAEGGVPVVVTYHPAYLLRSPSEKRKAWHDLLLAVQVFRGHAN